MTLPLMPRSTASEIWRSECEAINQEMDRLILSDWPRSHEENQVRKIQFIALIERRNEASRHFLAEATIRPRISSTEERASHSTEEGKPLHS
jgi:hypothetical protein